MKNTASGARESVSRTIIFKNKEHEKFYQGCLLKCRYQDVYHQSLVYCIGISEYDRYFWEVIKICYPEYCLYTEGEDVHVKS